jgi:hypothetical protein
MPKPPDKAPIPQRPPLPDDIKVIPRPPEDATDRVVGRDDKIPAGRRTQIEARRVARVNKRPAHHKRMT